MTAPTPQHNDSNIVDIFSRRTYSRHDEQRFVRLSPEYEGTCMLYSTSKSNPEKLFTMRILCWAIRDNGEVVGLVPWLNKVLPCDQLADPFYGQYEGYYDLNTERIFYQPPPHKVTELETAAHYFDDHCEANHDSPDTIIQEIPDSIGTHAMLTDDNSNGLILTEVLSWRLLKDGRLQAMLVDEEQVKGTPVLAGDPCLYPAEEEPNFRYFFQHQIANQIKSEDPEAMAAIALLFDP